MLRVRSLVLVALERASDEDACRFCCSFSSWSSDWSNRRQIQRGILLSQIIEEYSKFDHVGLRSITEKIPSTPVDARWDRSGCCKCFCSFADDKHSFVTLFRSVDGVEHSHLTVPPLSSRSDVDWSNPSYFRAPETIYFPACFFFLLRVRRKEKRRDIEKKLIGHAVDICRNSCHSDPNRTLWMHWRHVQQASISLIEPPRRSWSYIPAAVLSQESHSRWQLVFAQFSSAQRFADLHKVFFRVRSPLAARMKRVYESQWTFRRIDSFCLRPTVCQDHCVHRALSSCDQSLTWTYFHHPDLPEIVDESDRSNCVSTSSVLSAHQ